MITNKGKRKCCGTRLMNHKESICCLGKIYPIHPTRKFCCSDQVYDSTEQACFLNKLFPIGFSTSTSTTTPDYVYQD